MDAIQILDRYRASLAGDREGLLILARLLRLGSLTERELERDTQLDARRLGLKLNELFRAQLVSTIGVDRWTVTDLAEETLSRLGISGVIARSVLVDQRLNDVNRSFLEACIEARSHRDTRWPRYQTTLLRGVEVLQRELLRDVAKSEKKRTDFAFSIIVGLDTDVQQLGGAKYYESVLDWHRKQESELWNRYKGVWSENSKLLGSKCWQAAQKIKASNLLLVIHPSDERRLQKVAKGTVYLTLLRLLGASLSRVLDAGLSASYRANPELAITAWPALEEKCPDLEAYVDHLLVSLGKAGEGNDKSWKARLERRLGKLFANEPLLEEGFELSCGEDVRSSVQAALGPLKGVWLERILVRVRAQIDEGHYDHVPLTQRKLLRRLMLEAGQAMEERSGVAGEAQVQTGGKPQLPSRDSERRR